MADGRIKVLPETLRSRAASTFSGSYQTLGAVLAHPCRIVKFTNNCSVDVTLSWDGTNDHEYLPAGSFVLLDLTANAVDDAQFQIANGTQFYVKGSAGTGNFYISVYYAF